jgi:hypothetical protein
MIRNYTKQDWDELDELIRMEEKIVRNYKPITKERMDEYLQWMQEYYDSCEESKANPPSDQGKLQSMDKQTVRKPYRRQN